MSAMATHDRTHSYAGKMKGKSRFGDGQTAGKDTPNDEERGNGRMIFTGPDYIRDHRVTVESEHRAVGIGTMSQEGTSEVNYLWRSAPGTPYPRPKTSRVGEIGWGINWFTDWSQPVTGRQIMMGEFRQDLENRHSHRYQNPWYPGPDDVIDPDSDAALIHNVYRSRTSHSNHSRQNRRETSGNEDQQSELSHEETKGNSIAVH